MCFWSFQARDRKVVGDMEGARRYGFTARRLNILATVLGSILFLICFIPTIIFVNYDINYPRDTVSKVLYDHPYGG